MNTRNHTSLIPEDAFEQDTKEGTLGAEEGCGSLTLGPSSSLTGHRRFWLSSLRPCSRGAHRLRDRVEHGRARATRRVLADLVSRRRILLGHAEQLGRVLGTSGTHPIGDWREQEIIDKPHYQRLQKKLGWLIRRNNTFSLHVHYAVQGRRKAVYLFNRLREYVPHMLALSVNSPFWQGEYTDMHSARVLMFSRLPPRRATRALTHGWSTQITWTTSRAGLIDTLREIWWDVRLHPGLGTVEIRAFDAQTDVVRNEALVALSAALCDVLALEYDSGGPMPIIPNREIEENKWSAQRYGLEGIFIDHETHEAVETRTAVETLVRRLSKATYRDLSGVERVLGGPTGSVRQLEVWREMGSTLEVAKDLARRTSTL